MDNTTKTSEIVRDELVDILRNDLVGPTGRSIDIKDEMLPGYVTPLTWYLTGFLAPSNAPIEDRTEIIDENDLDEMSPEDPKDGNQPIERSSKSKKIVFPSSIGISFFVSKKAKSFIVTAAWGDYKREDYVDNSKISPGITHCWKRYPQSNSINVNITDLSETPKPYKAEAIGGVKVIITKRSVHLPDELNSLIPEGTCAVTVFLVNERERGQGAKEEDYIYQASIQVETDEGIVPRPNLVGFDSHDSDMRINDLQYRNVFNFCTGHGVSTIAESVNGECKKIKTEWVPEAQVERVVPNESIKGINLSMKDLSEADSFDQIKEMLLGFVSEYTAWIKTQRDIPDIRESERVKVVEELLARADVVCKRLENGINSLEDEKVLSAFKLANKVMYRQATQRLPKVLGRSLEEIERDKPISWRPFQLAFVLINLESVAFPDKQSSFRDTVDLLFFPTGGGKTEAYLGLAAFTLFYRRLTGNEYGVSIIMRYTLRLLTLDQLSRASTLICAMELERKSDEDNLGKWPFEIGLWVGMAATPNKLGSVGDDKDSARERIRFLHRKKPVSKPLPLETCPWCDHALEAESFRLDHVDHPKRMFVSCLSETCDFYKGAGKHLPILSIDDEIYRRLPCFLIATVDKFASMPFDGRIASIFGKAKRKDKDGFYTSLDPHKGEVLSKAILPPNLIIQDELHLISGPLGTMVGLYETVIDELCSYKLGDKKIYPKIIASTATVRRAEAQIKGLFARSNVEIFPPQGPNIRDSFFAYTMSSGEGDNPRSPARKYIGVSALGRPLKVIFMRTYLTMMSAAEKLYKDLEKPGKSNPVDPYMTIVGYFNSLRELGGSRRVVEDDIKTKLASYSQRKRLNEKESKFRNRKLKELDFIMELTSRESTAKVAEAKSRLNANFTENKKIDVALATNMISVGLDIPRLGLMISTGQPKTTSEYIQATSRVGRDPKKPGLVVTLYSLSRHRDRSHYENFQYFHETFYRSIEATSVTPFSPRALDKGLAGAIISYVRLMYEDFTPPLGAMKIIEKRSDLSDVAKIFYQRLENHKVFVNEAELAEYKSETARMVNHILDRWYSFVKDNNENGARTCYGFHEIDGAAHLIQNFLDESIMEDDFKKDLRVNRSMRDVEQVVDLNIKILHHPREKHVSRA